MRTLFLAARLTLVALTAGCTQAPRGGDAVPVPSGPAPGGPVVAFANGGLTATRGHPVTHAQRNVAHGVWTGADGVRLALGSDDYGDTSVGEAMYLRGLGVFDDAALLRMWSQDTPRAIFPGRRVGCLRDGCEASFLVLRGDPLADFGQVRGIVLRVKEGRLLPAPPE